MMYTVCGVRVIVHVGVRCEPGMGSKLGAMAHQSVGENNARVNATGVSVRAGSRPSLSRKKRPGHRDGFEDIGVSGAPNCPQGGGAWVLHRSLGGSGPDLALGATPCPVGLGVPLRSISTLGRLVLAPGQSLVNGSPLDRDFGPNKGPSIGLGLEANEPISWVGDVRAVDVGSSEEFAGFDVPHLGRQSVDKYVTGMLLLAPAAGGWCSSSLLGTLWFRPILGPGFDQCLATDRLGLAQERLCLSSIWEGDKGVGTRLWPRYRAIAADLAENPCGCLASEPCEMHGQSWIGRVGCCAMLCRGMLLWALLWCAVVCVMCCVPTWCCVVCGLVWSGLWCVSRVLVSIGAADILRQGGIRVCIHRKGSSCGGARRGPSRGLNPPVFSARNSWGLARSCLALSSLTCTKEAFDENRVTA